MTQSVRVCSSDAIEPEHGLRFDHAGHTHALCRGEDGAYYAMDGLCSHEQVALGDGFVFGFALECPRHQGRFDIRNGKALRAPACVDLRTHAVKVEAGSVHLGTD